MFHLLTVLAGLSIFSHCSVTADLAVSFEVETLGRQYTVNFNRTSLEQFHQCLCDDDTFTCSVETAKRTSIDTTFWAHFQDGFRSPRDTAYSNDYFCSLIVENYEPKRITCYRLEESIPDSQTQALQPPCEVFSFTSKSTQTCDLDCVGARWAVTQTTKITEIKSDILSCGLCGAARPPVNPGTAFTTTSALASSSATSGDDDDDDVIHELTDTHIIIVLVAFLGSSLIFAGVMIFIFVLHRRRQENSEEEQQPQNWWEVK